MAELDMSEELKEALNPGIFFMHDGSGEEGVKYGRTRLLYPGGKASEIIIPRLISENTSLRQKIEDLTSISDKLVNIFKKVYPLIEEELEIDNAIKEAQLQARVQDPFSPSGNVWVFPHDIVDEYFED